MNTHTTIPVRRKPDPELAAQLAPVTDGDMAWVLRHGRVAGRAVLTKPIGRRRWGAIHDQHGELGDFGSRNQAAWAVIECDERGAK